MNQYIHPRIGMDCCVPQDFIAAMKRPNCLALLTLSAVLLAAPLGPSWAQSGPPKPLSVAETIQQWLSRGAPEEALKVTVKELQRFPNDPNLTFQRAVILERLGQWDEAQGQYEALTQAFPELPEPQNNLGVLLARKGLWAEARARFELALRADPNNRLAKENLADVWLQLSNAQYRELLSKDPQNNRLRKKIDALQAPIQALKEATP